MEFACEIRIVPADLKEARVYLQIIECHLRHNQKRLKNAVRKEAELIIKELIEEAKKEAKMFLKGNPQLIEIKPSLEK